MAKLKSWRTTPPGGWVYHQAETNFTLKDENADALIKRVVDHRIYRSLTPTDEESVKAEIGRQICGRLGYAECRPEGKDDKWKPRDGSKPVIGMSQMLAFSKAAFAFISSGGELAPIEEVKRRQAMCLACPLSSMVTGCSCGAFYKAVDALVPASRSNAGLGICLACSCSTNAKTNLTEEQVHISNEGRDIQWPSDTPCWQAEIEAKYKVQENLPPS